MNRLTRWAVPVVLASVALAACGGGAKKASTHPSPSASASSSSSPSASPIPTGPPSPLSGRPAPVNAPVFAVKIDNTAPAHPQVGLNSADQVYVEEVEGGLTRLLAVFSSQLPPSVGPVRSVRTDNVDLLAEFGSKVAFAYSGGQPGVLSVVRSSAVLDVSYDVASAKYTRDPSRRAPYNLFTDPAALLQNRPTVATAKPMGFVFDEAKAPTEGIGQSVTVGYPSAKLVFTYDATVHGYLLTQDGVPVKGADGQPVVAANVVVQRVSQVSTRFKDVNGSYTPANVTVGSGDAQVLRDGHAIPSTWKRANLTAGTQLLTKRTGVDVSLRPGTTWVLLLPSHGSVTLS